MTEILDVLDEAGQVVDQRPREEVHDQQLRHRAVHVLLVQPDGRVLLQRRSHAKAAYPGRWTSSASGHVPSGQSPRAAAKREVAEEIGLTVARLEHVGQFTFRDATVGEHELVEVYTGGASGAPQLHPEEVLDLQARPPATIDAWLAREPEVFADSFLPVWALAREHLVPEP